MVTEDKMFVQAPSLAEIDGVAHGFFTRLGGVSEGLYASLNCGLGSRDDAANVAENRARTARLLGVPPEKLLTVYQKHSNAVVETKAPTASVWSSATAPPAASNLAQERTVLPRKAADVVARDPSITSTAPP